MTFKQVSTGAAYRYYGRQVAVGDGRRGRSESLDQAQAGAGVPPGVWMGRALPAVGLTRGSRVQEGQMANLFGEGRHPDAEQIVADHLATRGSRDAAQRATRLGYRIQRWSAIDLVFRAPGSVQVLWALAPDPVRRVIENAHARVLEEVLAEIESEHLWVRVGRDSIMQRAQEGLIAARFRHWENRDAMPLLHDHLVLSVKVVRTDGRWGTLHTRSLLEHVVTLSELYNQRLLEEICSELRLATVARYPTAGQRPVMKLAGIGEEVIDWAATRAAATMRQLLADEAAYQARTGRRPTVKIRRRLMERAAQTTRPRKKNAHPLPQLRARWREAAIARFGQALVDGLLDAARAAAQVIRATSRTVVDIATAALHVTAVVAVHHGGRFRRRHLLAEARRHLARTLRRHPAPPGTDQAITTAAIRDHCHPAPAADGAPLDHRTLTPRWEPAPPPTGTSPIGPQAPPPRPRRRRPAHRPGPYRRSSATGPTFRGVGFRAGAAAPAAPRA